uniref:NADH-ubiquinone oxidoreductase chain 1 n=1 Tax=Blattisocius keegani TaxID=2337216 RepID=A0A4Y5QDA0_9ACAR|nr:NADH dehydrogenase subunit 1 [Blattisocius keegani]
MFMVMVYIILYLMVMFSIAFVTLCERKILGYMQVRTGPNKILIIGLFQPLSDGLKLFIKENGCHFMMNKMFFISFPFFMFFLMFCYWMIFKFMFLDIWLYEIMGFILLSGLGVYGILGLGKNSNSMYSILGSYRGTVQTVSYEVGLVFVLLSMFMNTKSYMMSQMYNFQFNSLTLLMGYWSMWLIWMIIMLAELNRAPFDLIEGESELVSGFNVEYGAASFALIFLAEYGNIIFISYISMMVFSYKISMINVMMYMVIILWVRGVFPRMRYDNLMYLVWKWILPFILVIFMMLFNVKVIFWKDDRMSW